MAKILIIYTGGTIGMGQEKADDPGSALVPKGWEFLQEAMPSLSPSGFFCREKGIEFSYISFEKVIDSSEFTPSHWAKIAELIDKNYETHQGFIVIHGTDTMAYTASAMSFMFNNLSKPVVLTGSQLPIYHPRTDGTANLSNAIHIAAAPVFGLPIIPEVMICFNDTLIRGNRSTKSSSKDFSGFESPSYPSLGSLGQAIQIKDKHILPTPREMFSVSSSFETNVIIISLFPGFNSSILEKLADDHSLKGIILRTFGSGNAPSSDPFIKAVQSLIEKKKTVLNISQCQEGFVDMHKYKTGSNLSACGVIGGADMTVEAATSKLMWGLKNIPESELAGFLSSNIKGELSE